MIILLKTKTKTKDIIKTETETKTEPCWVCGDKFLNQIGLQSHMNKHWRENVVLNDIYNIKSEQPSAKATPE